MPRIDPVGHVEFLHRLVAAREQHAGKIEFGPQVKRQIEIEDRHVGAALIVQRCGNAEQSFRHAFCR